MKLTKLQRHTAYILMLSLFENGEADFFCTASDNVLGIEISYNNKMFEITFPELYAKKPIPTASPNCWFYTDEEGTAKRIELLKQCIEETY